MCINLHNVIYQPLQWINSSSPEENASQVTDDIFKRISLNENVRFFIKMSMKFVPKGPIENNPVLVLIMAWCRLGDKPLSEPILTKFTDAYMRH